MPINKHGNVTATTGGSLPQFGITGLVNKSGNIMTGKLDMGRNRIAVVSDPISNQDAAKKMYIDNVD